MKIFETHMIQSRDADLSFTLKWEQSPNVWTRTDQFDSYVYHLNEWIDDQSPAFQEWWNYTTPLDYGICDKSDIYTLKATINRNNFNYSRFNKLTVRVFGVNKGSYDLTLVGRIRVSLLWSPNLYAQPFTPNNPNNPNIVGVVTAYARTGKNPYAFINEINSKLDMLIIQGAVTKISDDGTSVSVTYPDAWNEGNMRIMGNKVSNLGNMKTMLGIVASKARQDYILALMNNGALVNSLVDDAIREAKDKGCVGIDLDWRLDDLTGVTNYLAAASSKIKAANLRFTMSLPLVRVFQLSGDVIDSLDRVHIYNICDNQNTGTPEPSWYDLNVGYLLSQFGKDRMIKLFPILPVHAENLDQIKPMLAYKKLFDQYGDLTLTQSQINDTYWISRSDAQTITKKAKTLFGGIGLDEIMDDMPMSSRPDKSIMDAICDSWKTQ